MFDESVEIGNSKDDRARLDSFNEASLCAESESGRGRLLDSKDISSIALRGADFTFRLARRQVRNQITKAMTKMTGRPATEEPMITASGAEATSRSRSRVGSEKPKNHFTRPIGRPVILVAFNDA